MVRALSIRQPWAWLIINAGKDIENRKWFSKYHGPLLIHAGKGMTRAEYDDVAAWLASRPELAHIRLPAREHLERGGIVGMVNMYGSVNRSDSSWFFGPNGLVFAGARPLPFTPYKGQLGFFRVPDELLPVEHRPLAATPRQEITINE
jgi:hypothetical protein